LEEDYINLVCRDVEASLRSFKSGDEVLGRERKAQNPMVIQFMFHLKWADLELTTVIVPRDCIVEGGALFPPTPRVAFGGD